jgi:hypothetical protein
MVIFHSVPCVAVVLGEKYQVDVIDDGAFGKNTHLEEL